MNHYSIEILEGFGPTRIFREVFPDETFSKLLKESERGKFFPGCVFEATKSRGNFLPYANFKYLKYLFRLILCFLIVSPPLPY